MSKVTEIVEFKAVSDVSDQQMMAIVHDLEEHFHKRQKGFIDTELLKGREDNQWFMIQHWATMEDLMSVVKLMMQSQETEAFRHALDPKTVKMQMSEQRGYWSLD